MQQFYSVFRKHRNDGGSVSGNVGHLCGNRLSAGDLVYSVYYRQAVFEQVAVHKFGMRRERKRVRGDISVFESFFRPATQFASAFQGLFNQPSSCGPDEFFFRAVIHFFRSVYRGGNEGGEITPADIFCRVRETEVEMRFVNYNELFHIMCFL